MHCITRNWEPTDKNIIFISQSGWNLLKEHNLVVLTLIIHDFLIKYRGISLAIYVFLPIYLRDFLNLLSLFTGQGKTEYWVLRHW